MQDESSTVGSKEAIFVICHKLCGWHPGGGGGGDMENQTG